jgi:hypothetical protein
MSTAGLFDAKRADGRAEWRVVFDLVADFEFGQTITYEALLEALGTTDKGRVYKAVGRANHELWRTRQRSVAVVRGIGYRMVKPTEHEILANSYRRQARRRVGNAVEVINAADLNFMSDSERDWHAKVQGGLTMLAAAMDNHEQRIRRIESIIDKAGMSAE